ncbi:LPS-assembly protein LptD [Oceanicella actignis]|uniref:LPS-assembly protein LptD n=1 Tax=Oceanicella actignis TaxID=1189325 RepID=UPI0011E70203|nr:LPS assembly protein LptD [Oceanicella actignis]TYO90032.1 LPS-assembly protein [Oceanicella actignis]
MRRSPQPFLRPYAVAAPLARALALGAPLILAGLSAQAAAAGGPGAPLRLAPPAPRPEAPGAALAPRPAPEASPIPARAPRAARRAGERGGAAFASVAQNLSAPARAAQAASAPNADAAGSGGGPLSRALASVAPDPDAPVALSADRVRYDNAAGLLIAEGAVEVHYGARTLTAERIIYDARADRVRAEGEVTLRGPEGAVIVADLADLDAQLREGLIRGARASLGAHARFAARAARRIDGRFNVLSRAVFSPCAVCPEDPTPLWRIRARRIVHDEREGVVHYEDATFDILGVPVAWTPYFRHPDPDRKRATGFLAPDYLQSSILGHAVKLPWHWVIDDSSDATLTAFVTSDEGVVLEGEHRRAYARGALRLAGSVTHNDYDGESRLRGHLDGAGLFALGSGAEAGFQLAMASDDAYLRRYGYSEKDRLTSEAYLRHGDAQGYAEASAVRFQSLRDDEPFGQIPMALPAFEGRRSWDEGVLGGVISADLSGYALRRTAGQDTARIGLGLEWERRGVEPVTGLSLAAHVSARGDVWRVADGADGADDAARFAPMAAVEARWPLARHDGADGPFGAATHILEPIAQLIAAPYADDDGLPNEDSVLTEFDETSLFSLRRHAGDDGFEEGPRMNLGLRYSVATPSGASFSASGGRVLRARAIDSFAGGQGLNKRESDFVGAWSLFLPGAFKIDNRLRVTDDLELRRNELYLGADWRGLQLNAYHVYLAKDSVTPDDRQEAAVSARYALTRAWSVGGEARRDLQAGDWVRALGRIGYRNECVDVEFYAGRRFTSSNDAPAATFFGARLRLWGLGGGAEPGPVQGTCAPRIR